MAPTFIHTLMWLPRSLKWKKELKRKLNTDKEEIKGTEDEEQNEK
ncbi:MAG: hypothetical protein P8Y81_07690 [Ignavibacteriaceae bacterium]